MTSSQIREPKVLYTRLDEGDNVTAVAFYIFYFSLSFCHWIRLVSINDQRPVNTCHWTLVTWLPHCRSWPPVATAGSFRNKCWSYPQQRQMPDASRVDVFLSSAKGVLPKWASCWCKKAAVEKYPRFMTPCDWHLSSSSWDGAKKRQHQLFVQSCLLNPLSWFSWEATLCGRVNNGRTLLTHISLL